MCRMILALGSVNKEKIFNACVAMSQGITAKHNGPVRVHPNGWGAIWKSMNNSDLLTTYHSIDTLTCNSVIDMPSSREISFLAVHARHATLQRNQGLQFAHPLKKKIKEQDWYMMHNGFMPTIHKALNMRESVFDSEEYMRFVFNQTSINNFCGRTLTDRLDALAPGNTSGNAFFISKQKAYVYQWFPSDSMIRSYFTLHTFESDNQFVVSSEIIPSIAPEEQWNKLERGDLLELSL